MKVVEQEMSLNMSGSQLEMREFFFIPDWLPCLKLSDPDSVYVSNNYIVRHKLQQKEAMIKTLATK